MKRKIGLISVLLVEVLIGVLYGVKSIWEGLVKALPFVTFIEKGIISFIDFIKGLLNIPYFRDFEEVAKNIIVIILINIVFVLLYLLIFGIIAAIQRKIRRNKLKKANDNQEQEYVLTDEEKAKFEWKLYVSKFPIRRLISLIVPIFFFLVFIVIRFDRYMCETYDKSIKGYFDWFRSVRPYIGELGTWLENVVSKYFIFNNQIFETIKVTWVEYIILGLAFILIGFIWWLLFSIFAKPLRNYFAKRKANKAKKRYILKMEMLEYKALKKTEKEARVSQKNKDLYENEVFLPDVEEDVTAIAEPTAPVEEDQTKGKGVSTIEQDYIDDISTGVTDLGLIEEDTSELQDPLSVREIHFVGDEEIDIVLEEEPVIETIEEEEIYYNDLEDDKEESFEHYQPENSLSLNIDDKIKKYNIDVIEEGEEVKHFEEETAPTIQEFEDRDIILPLNNQEHPKVKESLETNEVPETILETTNESVGEPTLKTKGKPTRPLNVNDDRSKVIEYILNTSKTNRLIVPQDSVEENSQQIDEVNVDNKKVKPLHPVKQNKTKNIKPINVKK